MRKMSIFLIMLIIALVGIAFSMYIVSSRGNPHIIEFLIGTVAVGILIGIMPSLLNSQVEAHPRLAAFVSIVALVVCVAVLVYFSNAPKELHLKIPVTYLVNLKTKEPPVNLHFQDTTTSICYMDAAVMFKRFKEKSAENSAAIDELLNDSGARTTSSLKIFRDLTEYLIPYFIGHIFSTPETELTLYAKTTAKWFGYPDKEIADQPKLLNDISGPFRENPFYGLQGMMPDSKIEMPLPNNTDVTLERDNSFNSVFIFKNKFLTMRIGISPWISMFGSYEFLHPSFAEDIGKEQGGHFKRYDTIIHIDVTFSRFRYGFPEMRYYEQWAKNLLFVLKRKFAWGNPPLLDPSRMLGNILEDEQGL